MSEVRHIEPAPTTWGIEELQLTHAAHGHILTNVGCWLPCGSCIVYDTRSDPAGSVFDGRSIESVDAKTGRTETLAIAEHDSCIGVVTCCPKTERIVFIQGPEYPDADWSYGPAHRRGVIVDLRDGRRTNMDAVCVSEPFTAGALRGGSHVHTFDSDGSWVAFTYEDHILQSALSDDAAELNQRNIGISVLGKPVTVHQGHPRNISGEAFSVLVSRTWDRPQPGSDEIRKAYEDAWVGLRGYRLPATEIRQKAIAFIGDTVSERGLIVPELYIIDLPDDVTAASEEGPLEGTKRMRPRPPKGTRQRRLTRTHERLYPGLSGPRHWPRSSPEGDRIYFLMRDEAGISQLWSIGPDGSQLTQVSFIAEGVASAFTVSSNGRFVAHIADGSVCVTDVRSGMTYRLTQKRSAADAPRPEACVFSPDGSAVAYVRPVSDRGTIWNQVFIVRIQMKD